MADITGKVTDASNGNPVENASIILGKKFALTTESGDYTITGITPGEYVISVLHRNYQTYQFSQVISNGMSPIDIAIVRE